MLKRMWCEEEGVLTFEWILLVTLLVIGTVGAMSGVRDAINSELTDVAAAMVSLDQSYSIASPIDNTVACNAKDGAVASLFTDAAHLSWTRQDGTTSQGAVIAPVACGTGLVP